MANVTYIRVKDSSGTTLTGDNGATWIPVSGAQIGVADASGSLAFTLASDDSIANTLDVALDAGNGLQIEVATYDNSTAGATSAGTLVSYATGAASLTNDGVNGGTHAFSASLQSLSTTTYPSGRGGPANASAFNFKTGKTAMPSIVPSDVASGAIVSAVNQNPSPSSLTYYAQFETTQGTYLKNAAGGTWFAIGTPTTGAENSAGSQTGGSFQDLGISLSDSAALPTLINDVGSKTALTAVHVEGLSGSSIIDNTTYEDVTPNGFSNEGNFQFTYSSYYTQHSATGGQTSAIGWNERSNQPDTGANAIAAAQPARLGAPPTSSLYFALNGVTGDANFPAVNVYTGENSSAIGPTQNDPIIASINTGFVVSAVDYSLSYASGLSTFEISSPDTNLALVEDNRLLSNTVGYSYIVHAGPKTDTEVDTLNAATHYDQINLSSGQHTYALSVAYEEIGLSASNGGPIGPVYSPPRPEAFPPATTAADPAAGMTYVQFRNASGTVVTSASGQSWFSASNARAFLSGAFNSNFVYATSADLSLTLGSDAPSATLDADIVAGKTLTAEVAVYNGAGTQLQADYVYSNASLASHVNDAASGSQTLAFLQGSFQESFYASGQATGSLSYDAGSGTTTATATQPSVAPQTAPTGNATPSTPETYVQFLGANGQAIAGTNGQTWFQVGEAGSELAAQPGSGPILGAFGADIGDDAIAASLDKAALTGSGVATINVASFVGNHTLQSYQRYTGTTVDSASIDNSGNDHQYTFDYTGYGETMPGPNPLFNPPATASAGTGASVPTLVDQAAAAAATATATMAPSLSTLSYYAELTYAGSEIFKGTSSGFVLVGDVSVNLLNDTATFSVGADHASDLAAFVAGGGEASRLEIAGYDPSGRALDYRLTAPMLHGSTADAATGVDEVTLDFAYIQATANGTTTTNRPNGNEAVDAPQDAPPPVCFAAGTRIRTARGDVLVEHLRVGDLAVTACGAHRPIRWIGHRVTDCRRHPRPNDVVPVRIAAHAFGEDHPARDLRVSPGHSLCVDVVGEVLIPAMALVNGSTIVREEVDTVTYWHVELDSHDILLAENMPAESYLAMGNRAFFGEAGVVALVAAPDAPAATHADFCRSFHAEGALVEGVRAQLAARAIALGWRLEDRGYRDLHLLVDGRRIDPQLCGSTAHFRLPPSTGSLWLVSPTSVPAEIAASPDRRPLGVCIAALTLEDGCGTRRTVPIDNPCLCVGFHAVERGGDASWRWTRDRACLPQELLEGMRGGVSLRIDLAGPALPRWVAPADRDDEGVALASA